MASALASLANATLTLNVPVAGTTVDATTGNVIPATTVSTYSLFVREVVTRSEQLPGIDTSESIFEGYCVDPQALAAGIGEGTLGVINFAGQGAYECKVLRTRHEYGSEGLLGKTLQAALGDKIRVQRLRAL